MESLSPNGVDHEVDVASSLLEALLAVVDGLVGTEAAYVARSARDAVPSTVAPTSWASCTAQAPTFPAAPWMRTVWPGCRWP